MKTYYKGIFKSIHGDIYELEVNCNGFLQAFFLLTVDVIRSAKHYQLNSITDEKGNIKMVDHILKCDMLLS